MIINNINIKKIKMERDLANELNTSKNLFDSEVVKNAVSVLLDEKTVSTDYVKTRDYEIFFAPGFRMMKKKGHECLLITISETCWVAVNVSNTVKCAYYGEGVFEQYIYGAPFVHSGKPALVYLVLFLWDLYRTESYDTLEFLTEVCRGKPFTTHHVFNNRAKHNVCHRTSIVTLNACCSMYADILNDVGDFNLSTELYRFKPWDIRTSSELFHHCNAQAIAQIEFLRIREGIHEVSLPHLINLLGALQYRYVNEGYFLFEDALMHNRLDLATWCWMGYRLRRKRLMSTVTQHTYNSVVEFVYSLA